MFASGAERLVRRERENHGLLQGNPSGFTWNTSEDLTCKFGEICEGQILTHVHI